MSEIQAGSIEAFGVLYNRYCDRAYRVAWWLCGERRRAENAVQEAFVSLWKQPETFRTPQSTVAAWLLSTVREHALQPVDRRPAVQPSAGRQTPHERALRVPLAPPVAVDSADGPEGLLFRLPQTQREVLTLACHGQLTHTEIAMALDLPSEIVKDRMRLGLRKLQEIVDPDVAETALDRRRAQPRERAVAPVRALPDRKTRLLRAVQRTLLLENRRVATRIGDNRVSTGDRPPRTRD